jgi:PIF1-like helicase
LKKKNFSKLPSAAEHDLQLQFQSCHFVIIDDFSMVGCALLGMVDKRLRQAKPGYSNVPFGNMFVYLFGDIMQLPPVIGLFIQKVPMPLLLWLTKAIWLTGLLKIVRF